MLARALSTTTSTNRSSSWIMLFSFGCLALAFTLDLFITRYYAATYAAPKAVIPDETTTTTLLLTKSSTRSTALEQWATWLARHVLMPLARWCFGTELVDIVSARQSQSAASSTRPTWPEAAAKQRKFVAFGTADTDDENETYDDVDYDNTPTLLLTLPSLPTLLSNMMQKIRLITTEKQNKALLRSDTSLFSQFFAPPTKVADKDLYEIESVNFVKRFMDSIVRTLVKHHRTCNDLLLTAAAVSACGVVVRQVVLTVVNQQYCCESRERHKKAAVLKLRQILHCTERMRPALLLNFVYYARVYIATKTYNLCVIEYLQCWMIKAAWWLDQVLSFARLLLWDIENCVRSNFRWMAEYAKNSLSLQSGVFYDFVKVITVFARTQWKLPLLLALKNFQYSKLIAKQQSYFTKPFATQNNTTKVDERDEWKTDPQETQLLEKLITCAFVDKTVAPPSDEVNIENCSTARLNFDCESTFVRALQPSRAAETENITLDQHLEKIRIPQELKRFPLPITKAKRNAHSSTASTAGSTCSSSSCSNRSSKVSGKQHTASDSRASVVARTERRRCLRRNEQTTSCSSTTSLSITTENSGSSETSASTRELNTTSSHTKNVTNRLVAPTSPGKTSSTALYSDAKRRGRPLSSSSSATTIAEDEHSISNDKLMESTVNTVTAMPTASDEKEKYQNDANDFTQNSIHISMSRSNDHIDSSNRSTRTSEIARNQSTNARCESDTDRSCSKITELKNKISRSSLRILGNKKDATSSSSPKPIENVFYNTYGIVMPQISEKKCSSETSKRLDSTGQNKGVRLTSSTTTVYASTNSVATKRTSNSESEFERRMRSTKEGAAVNSSSSRHKQLPRPSSSLRHASSASSSHPTSTTTMLTARNSRRGRRRTASLSKISSDSGVIFVDAHHHPHHGGGDGGEAAPSTTTTSGRSSKYSIVNFVKDFAQEARTETRSLYQATARPSLLHLSHLSRRVAGSVGRSTRSYIKREAQQFKHGLIQPISLSLVKRLRRTRERLAAELNEEDNYFSADEQDNNIDAGEADDRGDYVETRRITEQQRNIDASGDYYANRETFYGKKLQHTTVT